MACIPLLVVLWLIDRVVPNYVKLVIIRVADIFPLANDTRPCLARLVIKLIVGLEENYGIIWI